MLWTRARLAALTILLALVPAAPAAAASPSIEAKTHAVKAGKVRLGYRAFGTGRPLVLVMGFAGTIDNWDPAFLDQLARRHRVIVFDNRGVGRSTGGRARFTIHTMGDDTARLIRALRLKRPDVLGWSMGGFIAQDLAVHHPKLIHRLVLAATGPQAPFFTSPSVQVIQTLFGGQGGVGALLALLFPADRQDALNGWIERTAERGRLETIDPVTLTRQSQAISDWSLTKGSDDPRRIRVPTLIGAGLDDQLVPVENSRTLARRIRRARLVLYPDAAHGFLFQERARFVPRVERFLRSGR